MCVVVKLCLSRQSGEGPDGAEQRASERSGPHQRRAGGLTQGRLWLFGERPGIPLLCPVWPGQAGLLCVVQSTWAAERVAGGAWAPGLLTPSCSKLVHPMIPLDF